MVGIRSSLEASKPLELRNDLWASRAYQWLAHSSVVLEVQGSIPKEGRKVTFLSVSAHVSAFSGVGAGPVGTAMAESKFCRFH